jgi:serine/threonine protein kinase
MTQTHAQARAAGARAARTAQTPGPRCVKQWELVCLAAEGNLAQVYQVRPSGGPDDRPAMYALKMLRPQWLNDAAAVATLRREALVGRQVAHPHLIPVLAGCVSEPPYFVVSPWLEGATLAERRASGEPIDYVDLLWIARQVAEALGALQQAGWMHGDVKPSNIFLSPEMHVTLIDLGFARRPAEVASVADRCVLGTCNYMAPEVITSALRADIRSDIYSLGAVLFEMLSGQLPYRAESLAELATEHRQAPVPDLRRLAPLVPLEVVRLVRQMLSKEPLRRPQSAAELTDRLVALEIACFGHRGP